MACEWCDLLKKELERRDEEIKRLNEQQFDLSISTKDMVGFMEDMRSMVRQSVPVLRRQEINKPIEQGGYQWE